MICERCHVIGVVLSRCPTCTQEVCSLFCRPDDGMCLDCQTERCAKTGELFEDCRCWEHRREEARR